jgi:hypothetical protein
MQVQWIPVSTSLYDQCIYNLGSFSLKMVKQGIRASLMVVPFGSLTIIGHIACWSVCMSHLKDNQDPSILPFEVSMCAAQHPIFVSLQQVAKTRKLYMFLKD